MGRPRKRRAVTMSEMKEWAAKYKAGMSMEAIGRESNRCVDTIRRNLAKIGTKVPSRAVNVVKIIDYAKVFIPGEAYYLQGGAHSSGGRTTDQTTAASHVIPEAIIFDRVQHGDTKDHFIFHAENGMWLTTFTVNQLIGYKIFPLRRDHDEQAKSA